MTNNRKKLITSKENFKLCKRHMTEVEFYEKFELSMELVSQLTAETSILLNSNVDRILTKEELVEFKKNGVL